MENFVENVTVDFIFPILYFLSCTMYERNTFVLIKNPMKKRLYFSKD